MAANRCLVAAVPGGDGRPIFILKRGWIDLMKGGTAVICPELVRRNMAIAACVGLAGAGLCLLPKSPFGCVFSYCALISGLLHLLAFSAFHRFKNKPAFFIFISWFNVGLLAVAVSDTGGIFSPFVFLFFWVMVSEAIYGIKDSWLPFFAGACYLAAVYGDLPKLIGRPHGSPVFNYESGIAAIIVSGIVCAFILMAGLRSRYIISAVLAKLEMSRLKQDELGRKCGEMSPYSQIGKAVHRIAHDLRTPLASALGYLDFKITKTSDPDDQELLKYIRESLEQMSSMMTQITCYGRRSELKKERFCLKTLLAGIKTILAFHPSAAGVQFVSASPEGDVYVELPRYELQLALFNVIKNSLEAVAERAEKKVNIILRTTVSHAEIEVSDSGPGLKEQILEAVARGGETTKPDGTGVGLAIASDFIHEQGGTFEIGNSPDSGALVRIRLPLHSAA